jgi:hypothetical protein
LDETGVGCCPIGTTPWFRNIGDENSLTKHLIRKRGYDKSLSNHVITKGVENINGNQAVRK